MFHKLSVESKHHSQIPSPYPTVRISRVRAHTHQNTHTHTQQNRPPHTHTLIGSSTLLPSITFLKYFFAIF